MYNNNQSYISYWFVQVNPVIVEYTVHLQKFLNTPRITQKFKLRQTIEFLYKAEAKGDLLLGEEDIIRNYFCSLKLHILYLQNILYYRCFTRKFTAKSHTVILIKIPLQQTERGWIHLLKVFCHFVKGRQG